ncbi:MAG: FtsX-like permease family protein, partial [Bacteroidota bacterium]
QLRHLLLKYFKIHELVHPYVHQIVSTQSQISVEHVDFEVFQQQVAQLPGVESMSSSSSTMIVGGNSGVTAYFQNNTDSMWLNYNMVAQNYIDFMEIELVAGENFPKGVNSKEEQFLLLNETAVARMGYDTPDAAIGSMVQLGDDATQTLRVIGVTKDFHHDNIWFSTIQPFALRQGGDFQKKLDIRLAESNVPTTIADIHKTWESLSGGESINAYFTDTRMYHLDKFFRMGSSIIGFVGLLNIIISCMGLLGMVIYTVQGKMKEVGIRKILGASTAGLNWHLAKSFLMLLGIAIIIATPLTILAANQWLDFFVIRMSIGPGIVLMGVGLILGLALLTILSQTIFAARSNPVDVLRNE